MGRLLLICQVLSYPDKTQPGDWHQGRAEMKALAGLGDLVGDKGQSWPRPPALAFREKQSTCECICGLWHQGSASVWLWVPPCSMLTQHDKPLLVHV